MPSASALAYILISQTLCKLKDFSDTRARLSVDFLYLFAVQQHDIYQ